ncbi:hypothetical protein AG1IA_09638 [Rhizoctonia solani AG-1 IA]|uniref:Uncharacterized protein n=1 Tax=Thanatephorus cucumeris (strain AG1-IA) TaxID=983506 RepID=L8WDU6_THACA|nr:hypothetical protein AG1IA_09638 [Rhizoctonia solani AG-1 IA]
MPKRGWVWVGPNHIDSDEERPTKKRPTTRGKKGKAVAPNWTSTAVRHPGWSDDKPTGTWGKRCVDTWCLLAPYDSTITEAQWKKYYEERSMLDRINTIRGGKSDPIEAEELGQPSWTILQDSIENIAAAIMGSAQPQDADHKKRIAYVLLGSFYYLRVDGSYEGNGPPESRNLDIFSRLYSPFGIGSSVDFHYEYYFRQRSHKLSDERLASLTAKLRTIVDCGAEPPSQSEGDDEEEEDEEEGSNNAYIIFGGQEDGNGGLSTQFMSETTIKQFEKTLFGTEGWLSPRKMADILLASGGVLQYHEADTEAAVSFLNKFQYFTGENTGKRALAPEIKRMVLGEPDTPANSPYCVPQRRLWLARQG